MMLELCRLKHWAVAGMSINYIKCFDLIPRQVVLALPFKLGMDPGTCKICPRAHANLSPAATPPWSTWYLASSPPQGQLSGCCLRIPRTQVPHSPLS